MTVSNATLPRRSRHRGLCTAITEEGDECQRPVPPDAPTTFCTLHGLLAAQWMVQLHPELVDRVLAAEIEDARKRGPRFKVGKPTCVYYVRFGGHIKIGTTTNLPQRMQAIPHEEVIAIEPGSNPVERRRHFQFAALRFHGEWFRSSPGLERHMAALRAQYGEPMAAWDLVTRRSAADARPQRLGAIG